MNKNQLTRRRLMVAVAAFASAAALEPGSLLLGRAWAESTRPLDPGMRAAMVRMARLLYPHEALSDAVYAGVLDSTLSDVAGGAAFAAQLDKTAAALDARAGGAWQDLDPAAQIAAMHGIETEDFFVAIQGAVRAGLYFGPDFWKHIGYAGPSKGFGGYLHGGAGQVDWLPEKP